MGAGPAGSTAAGAVARAGASVVILDRATFPRDKPCGGGVTWRAARLLPFSLDPVVERVVHGLELGLSYRSRFRRRTRSALIYMTQRRNLDAFLAERAVKAGAEFRDGVKVARLEEDPEGVTVTTDSGSVRAQLVVGADGVNGVTARALGLADGREFCVALEGNVANGALGRSYDPSSAVLELAVLPGGYGWIFPKGDHANVGVAGWTSEGPRLRAHLERLVTHHGLTMEQVEGLRGYRLPMRAAGAPLVQGRALLAGDAAGLIDPLSGDGIHGAVTSGTLAAEAALEKLDGDAGALERYPTALTRTLGPLCTASWGWKAAFDRFPRLSYAITRVPLAWPVIVRLIRGDLHDPETAAGRDSIPVRLLALLGKASGDPGGPYRDELATARGGRPGRRQPRGVGTSSPAGDLVRDDVEPMAQLPT